MNTPRPYQQKSIYWANRQLNQGNNPLIVAPTGTGKTLTGTCIIKDRITLKERSLLIVPQLEILDEWQKEFSAHGMNYGYINDEGIVGRNKDVYVCMFQSLSGMLDIMPEKFCKSFQNIFIDESHRAPAKSYQDIFSHFSHCKRGGWTATPYRLDNKSLYPFFDTMYESIKMSEAIKSGFLCEPVIIIPDEYKNNIPTQDNFSTIDKNEQRQLIKDKKIIGDMLKVYSDVFSGLPVIIPCAGYEHAKLVSSMYESEGWKVGHLHSHLNKYDRRKIVQDVKTGKINILVTVGVGIEGLNVHGLFGIIWMRFTESLTIYMQFNGRAMRTAPGKTKFIMIDPVGNSVIHGRPDIDRKWSLDKDYTPGQDIEEQAIQMRICPVCDTANSQQNEKCWICGYDFINGETPDKKRRKLPRFIDGELVWLDENNFKGGENYNERIKDGNSYRNDISNIVHGGGNNNDSNNREITHPQKIEILKRDLIGTKNKNKFREGVKWL